jgi:pimeloyl-ACP methyl ester carboxylesterase
MLSAEPIAQVERGVRRHGEGDRAVVFVHGFLDDQHVWDEVIARLRTPGFERVRLDLAGCGERPCANGPFTYERYAADVGHVVDALEKPFVLVGQDMGAAIAELVAAARPERVLGLVLLTPVPLAGVRLADQAIEPFRSLGGDAQGQRRGRQQLSAELSETDLRRLVDIGLQMRAEVVRGMADCWNRGLVDAPERSEYAGPVRILRGAKDPFITKHVVSRRVEPRFASAATVVIAGAGHWPHVERPADVVAQLDDFLTTAVAPRSHAWREALAGRSAKDFEAALADDVVLEASVFGHPIEGRDLVAQVMEAASGIYESLVFTREASQGRRTYVEWEAATFGGVTMSGVSVLTENERGQIAHLRIHHRPLGPALRFSAELRKRLPASIDGSHLYGGSDAA